MLRCRLAVLGDHGRKFRKVFEGAQRQLMGVFGMEMMELPAKDKAIMSLEQKRKGESSAGNGTRAGNGENLLILAQ
jgi:hypothetical protein